MRRGEIVSVAKALESRERTNRKEKFCFIPAVIGRLVHICEMSEKPRKASLHRWGTASS